MRTFYWLFVLSIISLPCHLLAKDKLIIYTEHFPPYNFQDNEQIIGVNIDIVKLACEQAKIDCKVKLYPWKRAMELTKSQINSGLVSTARTPDREDLFTWIGPLVANQSCVFKLKRRTDIQIESQEDLLNNTIGLPWADVYEEILQNLGFQKDINYVTYYRKYGYGKAFQSGKLDLFIASSNTLSQHLSHLTLTIEDIEPVIILEASELGGNYLALNKNAPSHLAKKLQAEVSKITRSALLSTIKSKYIIPALAHHDGMTELEKACL